MSRRPASFTQADFARAIRRAKQTALRLGDAPLRGTQRDLAHGNTWAAIDFDCRYVFCAHCQNLHTAPWSSGLWGCPQLGEDWAVYAANEYVEQVLAQAVGQYPGFRETMIENLAWDVNYWARMFPWGRAVKYRLQRKDDDLAGRLKHRIEQATVRLNSTQRKLVRDHLYLVYSKDSLARRVYGVIGGRKTESAHLATLEAVGMKELEIRSRDSIRPLAPALRRTLSPISSEQCGSVSAWSADTLGRWMWPG